MLDEDTLEPSDAQRRTIYALATAPGPSGLAVIRVSGPDTRTVLARMVQPVSRASPAPRTLARCAIVHPDTGARLDDALVVFFPGPRSYTTEDVLELHVHGGRAVSAAILAALEVVPGARPALPGEFTRRAFEAGRMDLTQVEGLRDLVSARTEAQRRAALAVASGASRKRYEALRAEIVKCLANVEAVIDFGDDEDDVEWAAFEQARDRAVQLRDNIKALLADARRGEILREGVRLALFGPPNAGKSSLLNFLAQREAAIVTPVPGTTRDVLELELDIGGIPVRVSDTAGLRTTADVVEQIGVERARKAVEAANVSLLVLSAPEVFVETPEGPRVEIPDTVQSLINENTFILLNKRDLLPASLSLLPHGGWLVSLTTEQGTLDFMGGFAHALRKSQLLITRRYDFKRDTQDPDDAPLITHARHRAHLESALRFLDAFLTHGPEEIVLGAEELRYAAQAVGRISGLIDVEDVLDVVFRDFCIGK
ncbi:tRNA modification GTPase TrmE [Vararia minispora EC-137]|uniref:tRNA modification GTPase TrmE n=1 Tax=Vararia minispora EC-137 TaxID=1314806 RepID=A0ACB8QK50_9AGAM|nr:tRNA modification GTPase TrmE [Vararia minispora EC-137]